MRLKHDLYGLVAEFAEPAHAVEATRRAHDAGYTRVEAYSPYPVEGLAENLGFHHSAIPWITLLGGVIGATAGFALQYWSTVEAYPLNVGGRPLNSWPMFVPVMFEMTVLTAAIFAILGMFALNGLPEPHHPLFNIPDFERASRDRFFLCVQSRDPLFDPVKTRGFLESLKPIGIFEAPR